MKFKFGDRVAVYMDTRRLTGTINSPAYSTFSDDSFWVDYDQGTKNKMDILGSQVHRKQCRKLVKKQRRRIWMHKEELESRGLFLNKPPYNVFGGYYIEFVECKPKK